jgi:hypothetical protein
VNVHVWYARPVMDGRFTAVVDSPVQWIFNARLARGGRATHHLAISISGRGTRSVPHAGWPAMSAELAVHCRGPGRRGSWTPPS